MKIQYKNYLMTSNEGPSDRFDLEKLTQKTRKKDGESYEGADDMATL